MLQWVKVLSQSSSKGSLGGMNDYTVVVEFAIPNKCTLLDVPNIRVITGLLRCFSPAATLKMNQVRTSSSPLDSQRTTAGGVPKPYTWMFLGIVQVHRRRMSPSSKNYCFIHNIKGPMLGKVQITIILKIIHACQ